MSHGAKLHQNPRFCVGKCFHDLENVSVNDMKVIVVPHKFHFFFNSFLPSFEQNFTKLLFCVTQASSSFAVTQQKVSNFLYTICPDDLSECYVHDYFATDFQNSK